MSHRLPLIALLAALCAANARAEDPKPITSMFSFSGFGTLGVVHSSEDKADFISSVFQPNGAGYTHSWSPSVDSRIGAQLTAGFTSQLSALVQVVAEQRYDDTYKPSIEWANIKYQFTPDVSARIGRIVLPVYMVSDFRKVGYANPWVRPPTEVYGTNPITNINGADLSYRLHLGEMTTTLQGTYGREYTSHYPHGVSSKARDVWGIVDTTQYAAASFYVSLLQSHISLEPAITLFDVFRQFGPEGIAIADRYELLNKSVRVMTLGTSYDPGKWFAMAEWTQAKYHSFLGESKGWYVSGGYRIGKFTPYITDAQLTNSITTDPGLNLATLPPYLAGNAAALNAGLNQVLGRNPVQRTISAGLRWDFTKNFDFKLQCDHTRLGPGSPGTLINTQPGFRPGGTLNLISVTVDFVF
jgi:hypothetical protein